MYRPNIIAEKLMNCSYPRVIYTLNAIGTMNLQRSLQVFDGTSVQGYLQQVRNTWILKRRNPPRCISMDRFAINDLPFFRSHQRIYDLVERTDDRKKKPLKIILIKHVDGIGSAGEVLDIRPKTARNKLLLPGNAVYASPENLEKYADLIARTDNKPSSPFVHKTIGKLKTRTFNVCMNLENPWTIEPWHIRVGLRKAGIVAPDSAITLPSQPISGPDLSIEGREFLVKIKINNKEEAKARFRVHHVPTDLANRLPYKEKHWIKLAPPIFEEQAAELKELNNADPRMIEDKSPKIDLY